MTKALVKIAQGKAVVEIARVAMADSANRQLAKIEDAMLTYVETTDWAKAAVAAGSVEILARRQGLGQGVEGVDHRQIAADLEQRLRWLRRHGGVEYAHHFVAPIADHAARRFGRMGIRVALGQDNHSFCHGKKF